MYIRILPTHSQSLLSEEYVTKYKHSTPKIETDESWKKRDFVMAINSGEIWSKHIYRRCVQGVYYAFLFCNWMRQCCMYFV